MIEIPIKLRCPSFRFLRLSPNNFPKSKYERYKVNTEVEKELKKFQESVDSEGEANE